CFSSQSSPVFTRRRRNILLKNATNRLRVPPSFCRTWPYMTQPARARAGTEPCRVVVAGDRCISQDGMLGGTDPPVRHSSVGVAIAGTIWVALSSIWVASGQNPSPATTSGTAEVERVIVTGSNIPSAEEVGANSVDTYRPSDIEKLGVRNSTDLLINLPQQMGTAVNQNWSGVGDGSVIPNVRGLLPKETLVLIDGKRTAINGGAFGLLANASGVDINLVPFPMIDHI